MLIGHASWQFAILPAAWVLLAVLGSVIIRRRRGRYIFRPALPEAIFAEQWRSGRSLRNGMTRFGGASGCLWVAVTPDQLLIGPHFPFNLMFLPELYRLEHRIDVADVRGVDEGRTLLGGRRVSVRFIRSDGDSETMELQLIDPDRFRAAIAAAQARVR